ncbi:MAG: hypothetical protein LBR29_10445 [Methylobacteriaceae bacterium]|jgi:hypothetical protein|nr:hypothetical protein [Methylobacteriaceae bacterium]
MTVMFVVSLIGLVAILGLSFSGKFGNLLTRPGFIGSTARGMTGVFSFFIAVVLMIWSIGLLLLVGLVLSIAAFVSLKLKGKQFDIKVFRSKTEPGDDAWRRNREKGRGENAVITLEHTEWRDVSPPEKPKRARKSKGDKPPKDGG